jgi:hypothetical protein
VTTSVQILRSPGDLAQVNGEWLEFLAHGPSGSNLRNDPRRIALMLSLYPVLEPHIVVLRRHGRIVAIAPLHVEATAFALKWGSRALVARPFREMRLFGDDVVIARDADVDETLLQVFSAIGGEAPSFDAMAIYAVELASALWRFCATTLPVRGGFRFHVATAVERVHHLRLADSYDAYMSTLGAKTRQNLRRTTRRLMESGGRLVRVRRPEDVAGFLDHLDFVFQRSWQARELGRRPRSTPQERHYLEELARQNWLRAYVLLKGDMPVAFELGFQYGGTFYGHECGYDEAAAEHGPGSVLMHLVIEDLFASDKPDSLHFGFGHAAYKQSLGSTSSHEAAHVTMVPRLRWSTILALQRWLDRAHGRLSGQK